jgi:hypothetical protein
MPFFNHSVQSNNKIDFTHNNPVNVCATFNTLGKIRPDYIRCEDFNQEFHTFKIDSIKYTREYDNRILYCCSITNYGRKIEILLSFHIRQCIWTMYI